MSPIVAQIVDRCHASASFLAVAEYLASRIKGGRVGFLRLDRATRRALLRDAATQHQANRALYRAVTSGRFAYADGCSRDD